MKKCLVVLLLLFGLLVGRGQNKAATAKAAMDSVAVEVLKAPPAHSIRCKEAGVTLEQRGLYICRGLLWISLVAENQSAIDFRGNEVRVFIRNQRVLRRRARQEVVLRAVYRREVGVLGARQRVALCVAVAPRVPGKGEELVVEWMERDGDRRLKVAVTGKRVLGAKRLN
jgi:hypothetical protein